MRNLKVKINTEELTKLVGKISKNATDFNIFKKVYSRATDKINKLEIKYSKQPLTTTKRDGVWFVMFKTHNEYKTFWLNEINKEFFYEEQFYILKYLLIKLSFEYGHIDSYFKNENKIIVKKGVINES